MTSLACAKAWSIAPPTSALSNSRSSDEKASRARGLGTPMTKSKPDSWNQRSVSPVVLRFVRMPVLVGEPGDALALAHLGLAQVGSIQRNLPPVSLNTTRRASSISRPYLLYRPMMM